MNHEPRVIEFKGKKPSKAQIMAKVGFVADTGATLIEVYWGENGFTLDKSNGQWSGFGWIKDISADSIADQLNSKDWIQSKVIVKFVGF